MVVAGAAAAEGGVAGAAHTADAGRLADAARRAGVPAVVALPLPALRSERGGLHPPKDGGKMIVTN